jgi:glycerophosphoryl diester phosphodiesterase
MPTRLVRAARAAGSVLLVALVGLPAGRLLGHVPPAFAATPPRILVIAHRGFSDIAPENTLPAMTAAVEAHADMVEFDVQRTLDGHLIVVHDATFARTTNVGGVFPSRVNDNIGSFTLAEVQQLDAGSWRGAKFLGTRVPTLDQLLVRMRPTSTNLLLELKNPSLYRGYETQVATALAAHGFISERRVQVQSFDRSSLSAFHQAAPSVPIGLLTTRSVNAARVDSWVRTVNAATGSVNHAVVVSARTAKLQVFAWPQDPAQASPREIERLVHDGVSGIITDNPIRTRQLVSSATTTRA